MTGLMKRINQRRKKGNSGAALIMVIIVTAFVGMLVAMVVYMAYGNYLMKYNDKMGKDNFYSAERVLSIINGHLQEESSKSMMNAYSNALQTANNAGSTQLANYQSGYIDAIYDELRDAADAGHWNKSLLRGYASAESVPLAATPGAYGAYIDVRAGGENLLVKEDQKSVTLKDLRIVYTDDQGYVSIIETDIVMVTPDISFAAESKSLPISDFSLVANENLYIDTGKGGTDNVKISGDVYAGMEGLKVGNSTTASFESADPTDASLSYKLIAKNIDVSNSIAANELKVDTPYETFVNNINLDAGHATLGGVMNVGDDLEISGERSSVKLKGRYIGYGDSNSSSDVSSSILINGADTKLDFSELEKLVISGYAFVGATKYDANSTRYNAVYGANASDDDDKIEDVDAYNQTLEEKGTKIPQIDPVTGELLPGETNTGNLDTTVSNTSNPMMGESMASKAEQMIYMVPAECIGYLNDPATMSSANGVTVPTVQVLGKNPMTAAEYEMLTRDLKQGYGWDDYNTIAAQVQADTTIAAGDKEREIRERRAAWVKANRQYIPVDLNILTSKMPNLPANFLSNESYKAVYRRVNGSVLVYLYIDFGSDVSRANTFYRAYYDYDSKSLENYISSYVDKNNFKWNANWKSNHAVNALGKKVDYKTAAANPDVESLLTNSNMFFYDNRRNLSLMEDTATGTDASATIASEMYNYRASNTRSFNGLLYLLDASKVPSQAQKEKTLFENLIDESKLPTAEAPKRLYNQKVGGAAAGATDPIGVVKYGDYTYPTEDGDQIKVIVSTKDIYITQDFNGLALAKGNIYVSAGCSKINADKANVDTVLKQKTVADAVNEMKVIFYGAEVGDDAEIDNTRESDENKVVLSDYINYENWVKE